MKVDIKPGNRTVDTRIGTLFMDRGLAEDQVERLVRIIEANPGQDVIAASVGTHRIPDSDEYYDDTISVAPIGQYEEVIFRGTA